MSLDLDIQLREFCDFMDETQGPLTIDDILDRTGDVPVIPGRGVAGRRRTVSRVWMAAAAAVIALVIVGLAVRFLPVLQRDVPPATDNNPTTTTSTVRVPPVTQTTVVPGAVGPMGWTQATPPPGMEQVEEVWAMTDGGYALWTGSEIWTSADGMEWALSATTPGLADVWPEARSVIDFGGGWLDVGGDSEGDPVVAYSNDGAAWEVTPLPETRGEPLMLAASSSTAVVIGMALAPATDTVVWTSHDGRSWDRARTTAFAPESDGENVRPERLVFTGIEFVMQGVESWTVPGWFPRMWRSPEGEVWTEGDRYANGMHWDMRGGVEALTAFNGEPLVLQRSSAGPIYMNTFEPSKFVGWPSALNGSDEEWATGSWSTGSVPGEPVGGGLGVIVASTTDLWFTPNGDAWTSQRIRDAFGSEGDMIGAAVSDVSVLVAFSPNGREPIELWLGEPSE